MTPDERQALREKHSEQYGMCVFCMVPDTSDEQNFSWMPAIYPCDVIKVLDAWQNNTENGKVEPPEDCDHLAHEIDADWITWNYCPKCGEKL